MSDLYTMRDPTTQYPLPKFKKQRQRAPGSAKATIPKPDHGETSYRVAGGSAIEGSSHRRRFRHWRRLSNSLRPRGAEVAISYLPGEEPDAITKAEESSLASAFSQYGKPLGTAVLGVLSRSEVGEWNLKPFEFHGYHENRRVASFGFRYDYS